MELNTGIFFEKQHKISGYDHHGEVALSECMEYPIPLELEKVVIGKEVNISKRLPVIIKRQN